MGLTLESAFDQFHDESFDIILADHSFEHVPSPLAPLDFWNRVSRTTSKLIIFVPNGNGEHARSLGIKWGPLLGEAHILAYTMEWFRLNLPRHGWRPRFYTPDGDPLPEHEYLDDHWEITLVAKRT